MLPVLVLTFWSFKDALIQTYTLPYLRLIHKVAPKRKIFLLTLEKKHLEMSETERQMWEMELQKSNITLLSFPYVPFGFRAILIWLGIIWRLYWLILFEKVEFIHAFCTPAGAAAFFLKISTWRTLVIDSYEPHAEASVENGDWRRSSFRFKLLFFLEKRQSQYADYIISATEGMRNYALEKYGVEFWDNFFVKPACVDLELFGKNNLKKKDLLAKLGLENKIVAVYAGKFGGIYLDKEVFDFLKVAHDFWKDQFRVLLLTNQKEEDLRKWAEESGLDFGIIRTAFVFHAQIPDYMGLADFALTPVKPITTKRYCTPIKNGEYWALGLPVVSTANISDDSGIIEEHKIGAVIYEQNQQGYQKAVQEIHEILQGDRDELFTKIRKIAQNYRSFDKAEQIYRKIYTQIP